MRTYRLELVYEFGEGELEEAVLRPSADVARVLRPLFDGIDRGPRACRAGACRGGVSGVGASWEIDLA